MRKKTGPQDFGDAGGFLSKAGTRECLQTGCVIIFGALPWLLR
jgi:hypothetical protein